ncbi:MAG: glycosyltransferase family 87 protein [Sphingomicrobium sp.]
MNRRFLPTLDRRSVTLILLALLGAALALVFALPHRWTDYEHRDYATYWLAGRMVLDGADPYSSSAIAAAAHKLSGSTLQPYFSYPPHSLLLFAPLGALPLSGSFWVYQALGAGLFWVAARPYLPARFPAVALISPAALISFDFGQSGLLFGALWMFAFSGSALALACLTFRPQLGVLAGVEALRRETVVRAILAMLGIAAVTTLAFGPAVWPKWANELIAHSRFLGTNVIFYRQMVTPVVGYGLIGWAMFAGGAAFFLWRGFNVFTAATAAFLVSPHGLHYDMPIVCFGCAVVLFKHWDEASLHQRIALGLGYLSPGIVFFGTWLIPPILLLALREQVQLTRKSPPPTPLATD